MSTPHVVVVMGVAGTGKTTIGPLVSAALGTGVYGAAMLVVGLSPTEREGVARLIRRRSRAEAPG